MSIADAALLSDLLDLFVKVAAVMLVPFLGARLLKRADARSALWTTAIVGALLVPLFATFLPEWRLPLPAFGEARPELAATPSGSALPAPSASPHNAPLRLASASAPARLLQPRTSESWRVPSIGELALLAWLAGACFCLLKIGLGLARAFQLARTGRPTREAEWPLEALRAELGISRRVRCLESDAVPFPMTFGALRPVVLVPATAETWSPALRRTALSHELVHVAHHDWLALVSSRVACALYWFHPLVWLATRRAVVERELACDAGVLARGTEPSVYAGHLLEIARTMAKRPAAVTALAMAQRSHLEERIMSIRDARPSRRGSALLPLAVLVSMTAVAALVSSARPGSVQEEPRPPLEIVVEPVEPRAVEPVEPRTPEEPRLGDSEVGVVDGTWTLAIEPTGPKMQLVSRGRWGHMSSTLDLTASEKRSIEARLRDGNVTFALARDPGGFALDGKVTGLSGAGSFAFTANESFSAWLRTEGYGAASVDQLLVLATQNASYAGIAELARKSERRLTVEDLIDAYIERPVASSPGAGRQSVRGLSVDDLVRLAQCGVEPEDLHALLSEGLTIDEILQYSGHGVDLDEIRELRAAGLTGDPKDIASAAAYGVTPELVEGMRRVGYADASLQDLSRMASHGVDADYVGELVRAGFGTLSMDDIISLAVYGVDPDYIRELANIGYAELSVNELIRMAQYSVDPDLVRGLAEAGYGDLMVDDLVFLSQYGVDPDYVRELVAVGYSGLSMNDLARMGQYGVDPDLIRGLTEASYEGLSVDDLIRMAQYGVDPDYVRALSRSGFGALSVDDLIRAAMYGVDPDYIAEMHKVGYASDFESILQLGMYGVDADYVRELAELGYGGLSVEDLVRLWNAGVCADYLRKLNELGVASGAVDKVLGRERQGVH